MNHSIPDVELLRLLLHEHLHGGGVHEARGLRVHPARGLLLQVRLQPARHPRRRSLPHILRLQVGTLTQAEY